MKPHDRRRKPPLTEALILAWADQHKERTGEWPDSDSGLVVGGYYGDNWRRIDNALRYALRGLDGVSSLAKLLAEKRDVRNIQDLPPLTEALLLQWADQHFQQTGTWPKED